MIMDWYRLLTLLLRRFKHDKGALAGLIVGCIAFTGLLVAWALFAYRRHRIHREQTEAAAAVLGGSGLRAMTLDEEDEDDPQTRFVGAGSVSRAGGPLYDRLRGGNTLGSPGEEDIASPLGDTRGQDEAGGGTSVLAPVPILGRVGTGEDASLMHPANRSAPNVLLQGSTDALVGVPLSPPKSPVKSLAGTSTSGPGPDPAEWLGGRPVSFPSVPAGSSSGARPMSMSQSSIYSDEALSANRQSVGPELATAAALGGAYMSRNGSMSSHGHVYASSSAHGHASGSSSGGHGHSSGQTGSSHAHSPLLPQGPVPGSLLPTQKQVPVPPSAYRDVDEEGRSPATQRRMSGFLNRSLRGLRIGGSRVSVSSMSPAVGSPVVSPSASTTLLAAASPRESTIDPAPTRRTSIFRPKSPTLGTLPSPVIQPQPTIPVGTMAARVPGGPALSPSARTAHGLPVWPGLGPLHHAPDMPSPALTEGSSMHAPDGLLDPTLGMRLGAQGMQSQGAISFRDDIDYSRPIGGVSFEPLSDRQRCMN